jgi:hypothetical protein
MPKGKNCDLGEAKSCSRKNFFLYQAGTVDLCSFHPAKLLFLGQKIPYTKTFSGPKGLSPVVFSGKEAKLHKHAN